mgnify:CR=1 FL=1
MSNLDGDSEKLRRYFKHFVLRARRRIHVAEERSQVSYPLQYIVYSLPTKVDTTCE